MTGYCSRVGCTDDNIDMKLETNSELYKLAFLSSSRNPLEDKL